MEGTYEIKPSLITNSFTELFFFSLDNPETKNIILKIKYQLKFLLLFHFEKRRVRAVLFSFQNETTAKILADIWCLVHIKFLVIGLSNEKNN